MIGLSSTGQSSLRVPEGAADRPPLAGEDTLKTRATMRRGSAARILGKAGRYDRLDGFTFIGIASPLGRIGRLHKLYLI
jgi:hypothetical protein